MDEDLVRRALNDYFQQKRRKRGSKKFLFLIFLFIGLIFIASTLSAKVKHQPLQAASVVYPRLPVQPATPFAQIRGLGLKLYLPAAKSNVYAIGYHQAYNPKAMALDALEPLLETGGREVTVSTTLGTPKSFIMAARGRASLLNSSVDVAVKSDTVLKSPVSGRVLAVVPYLLYGKYNDVRIDILPDGYSDILVALTHIDKVLVKAGAKVVAGQTAVGQPRQLAFDSQINKYVGLPVVHVHIQVNPRAKEEEK